jgi:glycosyltransferase involved in cell wall biosynthesis
MALVSIVVPAYNEANSLRSFTDELAAVLVTATDDFEILFIDDGSSDATWRTVTTVTFPRASVRALRFSRNFGKEAAIAAGLDSATGDAVIVMDADLQHPPGLIPEMIARWKQGAPVVQAVKTSRGDETFIYAAMSRLFYGLMRRVDAPSTRNATDFCLLDARVVREWRRFRETSLFFRGMSAWLGFSPARVEFSVPPRVSGRSRWTLLRLFTYALRSLTAFTSAPLHLVTVLGCLVMLVAMVLGTRALLIKLSGNVIDGVTTIILLILFIGSALMLGLGVIGEYVARIYDEVKRRPRYVVGDEYDSSARAEPARLGRTSSRGVDGASSGEDRAVEAIVHARDRRK